MPKKRWKRREECNTTNQEVRLPFWGKVAIWVGATVALLAGLALVMFAPPVIPTFGALTPVLAEIIGAGVVVPATGVSTQAAAGVGLLCLSQILGAIGVINNYPYFTRDANMDLREVYSKMNEGQKYDFRENFAALANMYNAGINGTFSSTNLLFTIIQIRYDLNNSAMDWEADLTKGQVAEANMYRLLAYTDNIAAILQYTKVDGTPSQIKYPGDLKHYLLKGSIKSRIVNQHLIFTFSSPEYGNTEIKFPLLEYGLAVKAAFLNHRITDNYVVKSVPEEYKGPLETDEQKAMALFSQKHLISKPFGESIKEIAYIDVNGIDSPSKTNRIMVGNIRDKSILREPMLFISIGPANAKSGFQLKHVSMAFNLSEDVLIKLNPDIENRISNGQDLNHLSLNLGEYITID
ncbi:hypothetical protein OCA42_23345 [Bacillus cereus]|nr:hypothetical protein [Bacillus cereus]